MVASETTILEAEEIEVIPRSEFLDDYWDYQPGEHVTIIGPTRRGKTTLGFQLLDATVHPKKMTGYVLWSKPRDEGISVEQWAKRLNFKMIENYPPPPIHIRKPRGYVLKPHQTLKDIRADRKHVTSEFRACIMGCYSSKDARIVFVDEAQEVQGPMNLKEEMEAMWKRGSGLHCGCWALAQRSAYNSLDMYNAPEHLFLFNDPDQKNRERFGQIGGVDPRVVMHLTHTLGQYQVLYIKRTGPHMCVVDP